jgi:hypothetical protein
MDDEFGWVDDNFRLVLTELDEWCGPRNGWYPSWSVVVCDCMGKGWRITRLVGWTRIGGEKVCCWCGLDVA